jgi:hypothetical protein
MENEFDFDFEYADETTDQLNVCDFNIHSDKYNLLRVYYYKEEVYRLFIILIDGNGKYSGAGCKLTSHYGDNNELHEIYNSVIVRSRELLE